MSGERIESSREKELRVLTAGCSQGTEISKSFNSRSPERQSENYTNTWWLFVIPFVDLTPLRKEGLTQKADFKPLP